MVWYIVDGQQLVFGPRGCLSLRLPHSWFNASQDLIRKTRRLAVVEINGEIIALRMRDLFTGTHGIRSHNDCFLRRRIS